MREIMLTKKNLLAKRPASVTLFVISVDINSF